MAYLIALRNKLFCTSCLLHSQIVKPQFWTNNPEQLFIYSSKRNKLNYSISNPKLRYHTINLTDVSRIFVVNAVAHTVLHCFGNMTLPVFILFLLDLVCREMRTFTM